jgi:hypothetical protein
MNSKRKIDPALQSMLLGLANSEHSDVDLRREARELKIDALRESYRRIQSTDPSKFRPGDLVRWQPNMKYVKWPQYGEAAVVVECLDPPVLEVERQSGSPYFRNPMTLILGMHHQNGFHCWHFDGRRFELVP